jgi:hypothetical protein
LFCGGALASGQTQPPNSTIGAAETKQSSYGFVSPNTKENLTFTEAVKALSSRSEIRLIEKAREIGCKVGLKPRILKAVGSWSDGAEHSTLLKTSTDEATLRYLVSSLGRYARQKAVLYFRRSSNGPARMYILRVARARRNELAVTKVLDTEGVVYRTLVPERKRLSVYIVDLKSELAGKIVVIKRRLRARLLSIKGTGTLVGDEKDRDQAAAIFDQEIRNYEACHKLSLQPCFRSATHVK